MIITNVVITNGIRVLPSYLRFTLLSAFYSHIRVLPSRPSVHPSVRPSVSAFYPYPAANPYKHAATAYKHAATAYKHAATAYKHAATVYKHAAIKFKHIAMIFKYAAGISKLLARLF